MEWFPNLTTKLDCNQFKKSVNISIGFFLKNYFLGILYIISEQVSMGKSSRCGMKP